MEATREILSRERICVVVPTYLNEDTIADVVRRIMPFTHDIIVVIDGEPEATEEALRGIEDVTIISYPKNRGKGHALKEGFKKAIHSGFEYAITIDADGQHLPEDIPAITKAYQENGMVVGERMTNQDGQPIDSTFYRRMMNFWFYFQTGIRLRDTECGFRMYPLSKIRRARFITSRYEAELEMLVFIAWHELPINTVDISTYEPPEEKRVSHFRPVYDFMRISMLNIILLAIAIFYAIPVRLTHRIKGKKKVIVKKEGVAKEVEMCSGEDN